MTTFKNEERDIVYYIILNLEIFFWHKYETNEQNYRI